MPHVRSFGFSLITLCALAIWIAATTAQETPSPYTANLLDLTTGDSFRAPTDSDADQDGIPDNPFLTLTDNDQLWLAEVTEKSTGGRKTVAAIRWDEASKTRGEDSIIDLDTVRVDGSIQRVVLEVPRDLLATGEIGVVLLSIAPDLGTLLGVTQARLLQPEPRGVLVSGGQYVEISVMVSDDAGRTYIELDDRRLGEFPIRLAMHDLLLDDIALPAFHSHPTYVDSNPATGINLLAEAGTWEIVGTMSLQQEPFADDGTQLVSLNASLTSLSLFAPFDTGDTILDGSGTSTDEDADSDTAVNDTGTGGTQGNTTGTGTENTTGGDGTTNDTSSDGSSTSLLNGSETTSSAMAMGGGYEVWVDFGADGIELGTKNDPFNTIAEGVLDALTYGHDTMKIARRGPSFGTSETPTISSALTLEAVDGPILIGQGTQPLYTFFTGIGGVVYESIGMDLTALTYAMNPESRVYTEGERVLLHAYAGDGWVFDGWWYPEDDFEEEVSLDNFLPAAIHAFDMQRDRYVWPIFLENTTGLDTADPDDDGLANYRETELGTDPNDSDSDGDGLPDWWEVNYNLDPLLGSGPDGPTGDPDGDTVDNASEFAAGTHPTSLDEGNRAGSSATPQAGFHFRMSSANGTNYWVDNALDYFSFDPPPDVILPCAEHPLTECHTLAYYEGTNVTATYLYNYPGKVPVHWRWYLNNRPGTNGVSVYDIDEYTFSTNIFQLTVWLQDSDPAQAELQGITVSSPELPDGSGHGFVGDPFFDGGFEEWGSPDAYPSNIEFQEDQNPGRQPYPRAYVGFFNEVKDAVPNDSEAAPFDVHFYADIPATYDPDDYNFVWSLEAGSPSGGQLLTIGPSAILDFDQSNPPVPGLYKIRCEMRLPGESSATLERTGVAYLLLPYAGPEILDWLIEEARQIAGVGGVGEQWLQHVDDEALFGTVNFPIIGPLTFDPTRFRDRAFISVSNARFDYTFHMMIDGDVPTKRYNFTDGFRRSDDTKYDGNAWNDPSYATLQGLTVARQKITNLLFGVWGRSVGKSEDELLGLALANNILRSLKLESTSAVDSLKLGSDLYDSIVNSASNSDIINNILTRDSVRSIQSDGGLNDIRLWPRSDFTALPHTQLWIENNNLDDGATWVRPTLFLPAADMDLNPLTSGGF